MKLLGIAILVCLASSVLAWFAPAKDGNSDYFPPRQTYQPGTNVPLRGRCQKNSDCRQFRDTKTICYFNSCTRISTDDGDDDDDDKRRFAFSNQQSKRCRQRSDCSYLSFLNKTLPVECIHGRCSVVHVEPYDDEEPIAKKSVSPKYAGFLGRKYEPGTDVPLRGRCRKNSDCRQFRDTKTICYFNSCTRISTDDGDDDDDKKLSKRPKRDSLGFVRQAYVPGTNVRLRGRCRKNTDCAQREGSTTICYKKACTRISYDTADSEEEEKSKNTNKKSLRRSSKKPHSSKCHKKSDCKYLMFLNKTLPVECIFGRCSVIHVDESDSVVEEEEKPADIGNGAKFECKNDKDCTGGDICHKKECVQILKKQFPPIRSRDFPCRTQFECDQAFQHGNLINMPTPPPQCNADSDCNGGEICYHNDCVDIEHRSYGPPIVKLCHSNADCPPDAEYCIKMHCIAPIPGL